MINTTTTQQHPLKQKTKNSHFVRDLTWSRHQLEELAERRFRAAQDALRAEAAAAGRPYGDDDDDGVGGGGGGGNLGGAAGGDGGSTSFADLFKKVRFLCVEGARFVCRAGRGASVCFVCAALRPNPPPPPLATHPPY